MVGGETPRVLDSHDEYHVEKNARAVLSALELHGFESGGFSLRPTVTHWRQQIRALNGDWLKFMKWKIAAWCAIVQNQTPDQNPPGVVDRPEVLLGGRAMQWLKLIQRTRPDRFVLIIATMLTVKRAMERPGEKEMEAAVDKAFEALTTTRPRLTLPDLAHGITSDMLYDEVVRTTLEIAQDLKPFTRLDTLRPFFPSTRANYLSSRGKGGAVGYIMRSKMMRAMKAKKRAKLISWNTTGSARGWRSRRVVVDDTALLDKWDQLYEKLVTAAGKEEKKVILHALAEALKVRIISKGPVNTYTVLKPIQKWLWSHLKNHKSGVFRLIGEEISAEYLDNQIGVNLREGERYLSGDYSAATDNLDPLLSEAVIHTIKDKIADKRLRKLLLESLTGHIIVHPKTGEERPQKWGQLMGSITSFPVLCIVNAAICRKAREISTGQTVDLAHARIAVNGDDCVFRATTEGRWAWEALARASGMAPSVGKFFHSSEFLNMNSAQFLPVYGPSLKRGGATFWEVPRINMGLLVGLGRSVGKMEKGNKPASWGTINSIASNARTLVNECAAEDRHRVFKTYLNRNWEELKQTSLPWFLPEHLGGLGLPTFEGTQYHPTAKDLRLASAIFHHGKLPSRAPEGIEWSVWEHAQARMRDFPRQIHAGQELITQGDEGEIVANEMTLMGRLCVEALFVLEFKDVFNRKNKKGTSGSTVLGKLEDEVKRCRGFMGKVEAFAIDALPAFHPTADQNLSGFILSPTAHEARTQIAASSSIFS